MSDKPTAREYERARDLGAQCRRNGGKESDCRFLGSTKKVRILREQWLRGFQDENMAQKARRR